MIQHSMLCPSKVQLRTNQINMILVKKKGKGKKKEEKKLWKIEELIKHRKRNDILTGLYLTVLH